MFTGEVPVLSDTPRPLSSLTAPALSKELQLKLKEEEDLKVLFGTLANQSASTIIVSCLAESNGGEREGGREGSAEPAVSQFEIQLQAPRA